MHRTPSLHDEPRPNRRAQHPPATHTASAHTKIVSPLLRAVLAALCALALAMLAPAGPIAAARGLSRQQDDGTISGTLVNGTRGNAPVAGQSVTLQLTLGAQAHDLTTATTDAQGHFSFGSLATSARDIYAIYTRYEGGLYSTSAIRLNASQSQQATLTIYEATTSDANLSASETLLLVRRPRAANGLVGIGEFVTLHNSGTTAFVGTTAPANGLPMGLLRFALPAGATNLTPGLGFVGAQVLQVSTGFGATATVPPGDTVFAFAFDLPYSGTQALLSFKAEYPTAALTVLVPTNMRGGGQGFSAQGTGQAFGTTYQIFRASGLRQNDVYALRLAGLVAAGQSSDLDVRALTALAALLALLSALVLGLYLKRGVLSLALVADRLPGLGPAPHARAHARQDAERSYSDGPMPSTGGQRSAEHEALLRELLALERARAAGRLGEDRYRQRAGDVRAALRALLAAEGAPADAGGPVAAADGEAISAATTTGGGR